MKIYAAPLQGFTESPWRVAHATLAGGVDEYFAPFSRVEKGAVRRRDIRDFMADGVSDGSHSVTPQAIFRDVEELRMIADTLFEAGASSLDLNMGCPFPPQVKKGRGAAMISRRPVIEDVAKQLERWPEKQFSIKMRLGVDDPHQWIDIIDVVNDMPLRHLTVHPRTALMQYGGDLLMDEFQQLVERCRRPLVFNGDLVSPTDIERIAGRYPDLAGVMLGRGLLSRPSLAREWREGVELDPDRQLCEAVAIHDMILDHYGSTLQGDHQLLQKIKPYWSYLTDLLPRRAAKAIHKSTSMSSYRAAVDQIRNAALIRPQSDRRC